MKQLNTNYHYSRDLVQVTINCDGSNWLLAWGCGQTHKNDDHKVTINTDRLKSDEIPEELITADAQAELIVKLLNLYFRGQLFTGDPNQKELFNDNN